MPRSILEAAVQLALPLNGLHQDVEHQPGLELVTSQSALTRTCESLSARACPVFRFLIAACPDGRRRTCVLRPYPLSAERARSLGFGDKNARFAGSLLAATRSTSGRDSGERCPRRQPPLPCNAVRGVGVESVPFIVSRDS